MTECQVCGARSQLFLCRNHIAELSEMLTGLPRWIDHLSDVALRRTKSGGGGGRRTKGEEYPALFSPDTEGRDGKSLKSKQARAADLVVKVRETITFWLKHLCTVYRTDWVVFVDRGFVGPLRPGEFRRYTYPTLDDAAHWLAWHSRTIAGQESAGRCFGAFALHIRTIDSVINPPLPTRFLGRCPTWNERNMRACGTELRCREGTLQVTCPNCRHTHNADRLQLLMMNDLERKKLTIDKILELNRTVIPEEFRISERTLRRWRRPGPHGEPPRLKPRGYRRADGREVINRHSDDDEPLYAWADVTRLRSEKPDRKATAS